MGTEETKKTRGRPRISREDFRHVVSIRLTIDEKEKLSFLAKKVDIPLSEYMRNLLLKEIK